MPAAQRELRAPPRADDPLVQAGVAETGANHDRQDFTRQPGMPPMKPVRSSTHQSAVRETSEGNTSFMSLHRIIVLAVVALLAVPGAAVAQDATQDGYGDDSGQVQDTVTESTETEEEPAVAGESAAPAPQAAAPAQQQLPFTGDDEVVIALAGALLLGTGVAMRRLARSH